MTRTLNLVTLVYLDDDNDDGDSGNVVQCGDYVYKHMGYLMDVSGCRALITRKCATC